MLNNPRKSRHLQRRQRGAAMVEFVVITPILITLILWSMYFTELVRARLRLHEAARFITWEMTSYPVSDFDTGNATHEAYFNDAKNEILPAAQTRFGDLDSVDQRPGLASMAMTADGFTATMENQTVDSFNAPANTGGAGGLFAGVAGLISGGMNAVLGAWNFNTKGKASVEVSVNVQNRILPTNYLDSNKTDVRGGNSRLNNMTLRAKHVMIVNGWHLRDGSDALMGKDHGAERAGGRDEDDGAHSLKQQVKAMTFGGLGDLIGGPLSGAFSVASQILPIPNFLGTYVVSYNFKPDAEQNSPDTTSEQKGCSENDRAGNTASGGTAGYINLDTASELDHDRLRCFNTAPFRDTFAYNNGESLYREMFRARGEWFMGCKNPQADDPTTDADPNAQDQADKVNCGP